MKTDEFGAVLPVNDDALLVNNAWGRKRLAEGDVLEQIVGIGEPIFGGAPFWRWKIETEKPGVKTFPQILYGKNPWRSDSTLAALPMNIARLTNPRHPLPFFLDLDYSAVVKAEGTWNLMVDLWITSGEPHGPGEITHEIMVVLAGDRWTSERHRKEDPVVGGVDWLGYQYRHHNDKWDCIVFDYDAVRPTGILPVHSVLDWCRRWAGLREGHLACVELGTEVVSGSGLAVVERFEIGWS